MITGTFVLFELSFLFCHKARAKPKRVTKFLDKATALGQELQGWLIQQLKDVIGNRDFSILVLLATLRVCPIPRLASLRVTRWWSPSQASQPYLAVGRGSPFYTRLGRPLPEPLLQGMWHMWPITSLGNGPHGETHQDLPPHEGQSRKHKGRRLNRSGFS
jgi:hypothetical protein